MNTQIAQTDTNQLTSGLPFFFRQVCKHIANLRYGAVVFILPDGRHLEFRGSEEQEAKAIIQIRNYAFARRTILGGDIGFFESYADDQWDTPDLAACLCVFARNADVIQEAFKAPFVFDILNMVRHTFNKNTRSGSRRNIMAHYDLGNSFYEKWLDPTMTYSSARFSSPGADLKSAQQNKYSALARSIELKPDENVLEIGSGWGGFAEYAAKHVGANVTGLTLSPSQYDYARERIFREGLNEKVQFRLQDYRDVSETYDKIASIEMFEAVGKEYWPTYFEKVRNVLKPGGVAGFQIITIADRFFENYLRSPDFIQRYVFPGGMLPSPTILKELISKAGLSLQSVNEFGEDYARTLHEWHERFNTAWDEIRPLGFDDQFKKLWKFYLAYCEAGFRAGTTNVSQVAVTRA
ncbi:MAG: cyclopropane-fatty-acyl-phospholipid synthase [Hyphococcus sp.]|nr:MAG: cyclopropane-fatty-acyl-phospholipid synthase [Marinicaulis sp.]